MTRAHLLVAIAGIVGALVPHVATADRGALTVEAGGTVALTRLEPSVGTGESVGGTLGGAMLGMRYALGSRVEVHASGFWTAPARFVSRPVALTTAAGAFDGDLRREVSRVGAGVGARYVLAGLVWRVPVGAEIGWVRTSARNQDLVPRPGGESFVPLGFANESSHRLFIAPFTGVEWQVADHFSVSLLPRLEVPLGGGTTVAVVAPLLVGWSWFLL
jgi:hypothetical protein